jgi:hypothetical protein
VWTWDSLSLALLLDWAPHETPDVPLADGAATLTLRAEESSPAHHSIAPWPFSAERLSVRCEGRRLEGRYRDEGEMRAALARAPWVTVTFELAPGRSDRVD